MDAYAKTSNLIKDNLEVLHQLAGALLEKETLDGKIEEILVQHEKNRTIPSMNPTPSFTLSWLEYPSI